MVNKKIIAYAIIIMAGVIMLTACSVPYKTTRGGVRVSDPKVFKYNNPKYTAKNRVGIDTDAVYLKVSVSRSWNDPPEEEVCCNFMRFFPLGQVIRVLSGTMPVAGDVNNKDAGTPGYFIVEGNKIKISIFEYTDGGSSIGYYFGRLQDNGDLIMYEQSSATNFNSFFLTEKFDGSYFSRWKKVNIEGFEPYTPEW